MSCFYACICIFVRVSLVREVRLYTGFFVNSACLRIRLLMPCRANLGKVYPYSPASREMGNVRQTVYAFATFVFGYNRGSENEGGCPHYEQIITIPKFHHSTLTKTFLKLFLKLGVFARHRQFLLHSPCHTGVSLPFSQLMVHLPSRA